MDLNTGIGSRFAGKATKKNLIIIVIAVILIIAITAVSVSHFKSKSIQKNTAMLSTAIVAKRDLCAAVSGSGPIGASSKYTLTSNVSGTVTKLCFEDGDKVTAGDLIFEIDDKDTQLQIRQLKSSIAQAQLTRNRNIKDLLSGTVIAPIDGEIEDLQVKYGDNISNNGTLLTITDKSKLKLVVSFRNTYRSEICDGQKVKVNVFDTNRDEMHIAEGRISTFSTPNYVTGDGTEMYNAGVVIENPGFLAEGMIANVEMNIGNIKVTSVNSSTLSYLNSMTVKIQSGGTIKDINVEKGQIVKAGDILAEINNEDLELTIQTNDLKLEDLSSQLQTAEEKLSDYKIYAPFNGTLTLNDIRQGNSIKQGDMLGSVANYDIMEFSINVDELDISKIQVGQEARVTIDALPETTDTPLFGAVTKVAVEGTSSNGVSTYPVTVQIEQNKSLKGSMNANAEIIVTQKNGVLCVPVDAVQKRNGKSYVRVLGQAAGTNGANRQQGSGQETEMKEIITGISTEEYIEIISGIKEGEAVVLLSSSNSDNSRQMMPGGIGIPMGGNPPRDGSFRRGN